MRHQLKKSKRIVVKVGSGIVTNPQGLHTPFFRQLAGVVKKLRGKGIEVVLVSSGAIACGMTFLKIKSRPKKIPQKQAVAALGQPLLMHDYIRSFGKQGLLVSQILLTRDDLEDRRRFGNAKHAMNELFRLKAVPIVNENDSVAVEEIQFGDNDQLSAMVAHLVDADLLVILTDTDGMHDKDPRRHRDSKRISVIEKIDAKAFKMAKGTRSAKSTGGMATKLKAAQMAARFGIPTLIASGKTPRVLLDVLSGEDVGTLFKV